MANKDDKEQKIPLTKRIIDSFRSSNKKIEAELTDLKPSEIKEIENPSRDKMNDILKHIQGEQSQGKNAGILDIQAILNQKNNDTNIASKSNKESVHDIIDKIEGGFSPDSLQGESNRINLYNDYDAIDDKIPELATSLDVYTDAIQSPDDTSKRSINATYGTGDDLLVEADKEVLYRNIDKLIKKFKLEERIPSDIREGLKYGDVFMLIKDVRDSSNKMLNENELILDEEEEFILTESMIRDEESENLLENLYASIYKGSKDNKGLYGTQDKLTQNKDDIINDTAADIVKRINKNVKFHDDPTDLISKAKKVMDNSNDIEDKDIDFGLSGAYMKELDPRNIIKLDIDGVCLGYIYYEGQDPAESSMGNTQANNSGNASMLQTMSAQMSSTTTNSYSQTSSSSRDGNPSSQTSTSNSGMNYEVITDLFIKGISKKISKDFIKDNPEMKDTIYNLVKSDFLLTKGVHMTYLRADEVVHLKLDSNGTYGLSRLSKSLFFAKMYLATLMTNLMVKVTKGRDKKAYYVDVGIDSDIEGVVQGLIKDMRSNEFNLGTMEDGSMSVSTMLKQVGSGDEYFIPTIDGAAPFNIETISGDQVDIQDDFLAYLLKSTVSGTGVPSSYIDASQETDFARSLAMQNNSFVRKIVRYQTIFGEFWSEVIQKLYQYEYPNVEDEKSNIDSSKIHITFPAPIFMNIANVNDQISSVSSTIEFVMSNFIVETDNADELKLEFKKKLAQDMYLPSLDWDKFNTLFESAKAETIKKELAKPKSGSEEEEQF